MPIYREITNFYNTILQGYEYVTDFYCRFYFYLMVIKIKEKRSIFLTKIP